MTTNIEKRVLVKTIKVSLPCSKIECTGSYEFTGEVNAIQTTPYFTHTCHVCNDEQNLSKKYPYLEYEE